MVSVLGKRHKIVFGFFFVFEHKIYLKYLLKEIIKKLILINFNYFILKLIIEYILTMGIDLTCDTKDFSCSYSSWHNIRAELIEATFAYLEDLIANQTKGIDEERLEYSVIGHLKQYITEIREECASFDNDKPPISPFALLFSKRTIFNAFSEHLGDLCFINILIQFGVGGIYTLCNKSDCEGFYSVGNSYDICELLNVIKPFTIKNKDNLDDEENYIYRCTDKLIELFQESLDKKLIVYIS